MRKRVTRAVPQDHQAPWMTTINQKAPRTRVLNEMLFRSSQNYRWSGLAATFRGFGWVAMVIGAYAEDVTARDGYDSGEE